MIPAPFQVAELEELPTLKELHADAATRNVARHHVDDAVAFAGVGDVVAECGLEGWSKR
jgi:hypothetical protein